LAASAARQAREKEIQDKHMAHKDIKWKNPDDGLKRHHMENPDDGSQRHHMDNPDDGTLRHHMENPDDG
jgi:hypothetical protein